MNILLQSILLLLILVTIDMCSVVYRLRPNGMQKILRLLKEDKGYFKKQELFNPAKKKGILIVGDSTVTGAGSVQDETVPARLSQKFNATVLNLAENGARTREVGKQFDKIKSKQFDLIIVHAGNNDVWKMTPLKELPQAISQLLDKAKQHSKQVILFRGGNIGSCPFCPITIGWLYTYRARRVRNMYSKIAQEKNVVYAEMWMERKNDIFNTNPKKYYCWDMLHLNGTGLKVWFDYLVDEMKNNNIKI